MAGNAIRDISGTGSFASARKGGLTGDEIRQIEALRSGPRPVPWQAIAARYGRCMEDIQRAFQPLPANDLKPVTAWHLGPCSEKVQAFVLAECKRHGVTTSEIAAVRRADSGYSNHRRLAQRAIYLSTATTFRAMSMVDLGALFMRTPDQMNRTINDERRRALEAGMEHVSAPLARVIDGIAEKVAAK